MKATIQLYLILWAIFLGNIGAQNTQVVSGIRTLDGQELTTAELDSFIDQQMNELKVPGLSLGIVYNGQLKYVASRGVINIETEKEVEDNSIFEAASLSKTIFTYFVLKVVEEEKLNLDLPLYKYLPHPDLLKDTLANLITARMVLNHTSGLVNWREENMDGILKLQFRPGTQYLYSGEAYQYLAMVIMSIYKVDSKGLEKIFQRLVSSPLKMKNTAFIESARLKKNKASPHVEGKVYSLEDDYWYKKEKGIFIAGSSLLTNATDYSKFLVELISPKNIKQELLLSIFVPSSDLPKNHPYRSYGIHHWGLGVYILETKDGFMYGHGGANKGFNALFNISRQQKCGYVFFINCEYGEAFGLKFNQYFTNKSK